MYVRVWRINIYNEILSTLHSGISSFCSISIIRENVITQTTILKHLAYDSFGNLRNLHRKQYFQLDMNAKLWRITLPGIVTWKWLGKSAFPT